MKNYDEREKARKFEIDQLKDAFEILSGSQLQRRLREWISFGMLLKQPEKS